MLHKCKKCGKQLWFREEYDSDLCYACRLVAIKNGTWEQIRQEGLRQEQIRQEGLRHIEQNLKAKL